MQADVVLIGGALNNYFSEMGRLMANTTVVADDDEAGAVDWPELGSQVLLDLQEATSMTSLVLQAQIANYLGMATMG